MEGGDETMNRWMILLGILGWTGGSYLWAQEGTGASGASFQAVLDPIEFGFRFDDNVFRAASSNGRLADGVYLLDLGGELGLKKDLFEGTLHYHLSTDQYQRYSQLNNLKNQFGLSLSADPDPFSFIYKYGIFLRTSEDDDYNYVDDNHLLGVLWTPQGPWAYEARYVRHSKTYYSQAQQFSSRNYLDNGAYLGVQREIGENFSIRLSGSLNHRQFNRPSIESDGVTPSPTLRHVDETWMIHLNARLFFASVLQDIDLEQQRTQSNSYGFSNVARSISWAAVVRPAKTLYLQLLGRLYWKDYDVAPILSPTLQVGFVDEDSQEVLSARATWEWSPQWMLSVGASRVRNESTQPGVFYIKSLFSVQVRRNF